MKAECLTGSRFLAGDIPDPFGKGERAVQFIERLTHTEGPLAGQQFKLIGWQEPAVRKIFGDVNPDGMRKVRTVFVLLPRGSSDRVSAKAIYTGPLVAPVEEGQRVGVLRVQRGDTVALDQPLYAGAAVEQGTLPQRAMDAALEFGTGLVRKALDRAGKGGDKGGDKAANPS